MADNKPNDDAADKADKKPTPDAACKGADKLQAGLAGIVERATSALNSVKEGKVTPAVFAALASMERDLKGLREAYPSPKAARAFTAAEFDKFVADETAAIVGESNPDVAKLRTQCLGESVRDFRKALDALPANAADQSPKANVSVYMDPWRPGMEPTRTVPAGGGAPGVPTNAFPGGQPAPGSGPTAKADGATPPATPPATDIDKGDTDDGLAPDDGKWPMDMGGGADHPDPMVRFGKRRAAIPKVVGAVGDMTAEPDPAAR